MFKPGDGPEESRLSAPARPQQRHDRSGGDVEIHSLENGGGSERLGYPPDDEVLVGAPVVGARSTGGRHLKVRHA